MAGVAAWASCVVVVGVLGAWGVGRIMAHGGAVMVRGALCDTVLYTCAAE